jgi:hypothetical protein
MDRWHKRDTPVAWFETGLKIRKSHTNRQCEDLKRSKLAPSLPLCVRLLRVGRKSSQKSPVSEVIRVKPEKGFWFHSRRTE